MCPRAEPSLAAEADDSVRQTGVDRLVGCSAWLAMAHGPWPCLALGVDPKVSSLHLQLYLLLSLLILTTAPFCSHLINVTHFLPPDQYGMVLHGSVSHCTLSHCTSPTATADELCLLCQLCFRFQATATFQSQVSLHAPSPRDEVPVTGEASAEATGCSQHLDQFLDRKPPGDTR